MRSSAARLLLCALLCTLAVATPAAADAQRGSEGECEAPCEEGSLQPSYEPRPAPEPAVYTTKYFFATTRAVANSTIVPAGRVPLFLFTIPIDTVFLPIAAIAGFFPGD